MATLKQRKLAKAIVENFKNDKPKTATQLLESVGYSRTTAEAKSGEIIEQKGVQQELVKYGFDEESAKNVVVDVMEKAIWEPNARLRAADMIFKVHGSYAPEKSVQVQVTGDVKDFSKFQELKEKFEQELLETIANN
jgi:hypothetical protein